LNKHPECQSKGKTFKLLDDLFIFGKSPFRQAADTTNAVSFQDVVNEEAKGRGGSKVISNPFEGIAPLPVAVPPDPLSGLMAMEAEEIAAAAEEAKSDQVPIPLNFFFRR
jgi:hypothetical protein